MRTNEISESEFLRLKEEVTRTQKEAERAKGALETLMSQLKSQFGFNSIAEAEEGLAKLEEQCRQAQQEFLKAFDEYKKKWDRH